MRLLLCLLAAVLAPASAHAATLVDLGGPTTGRLVADPVRPVFYVALDADEVAFVHAEAATVTRFVPLPGRPAAMAVEPDGSTLWVGIGIPAQVVPIDIESGAVGTPIPVSVSSAEVNEPIDMSVSCDRVYATFEEGLAVIDKESRTEAWFGTPAGVDWRGSWSALIEVIPGRRQAIMRLLQTMYLLDITDEVPAYLGRSAEGMLSGRTTAGLQLSPDGDVVYTDVGCCFQWGALSTTPPFEPLHEYHVQSQFAVSPDGSVGYGGLSLGGNFFATDLATGLAWHAGRSEMMLQGPRPVALSHEGATMAFTSGYSTGFQWLELHDTETFEVNQGGVQLRPIDKVTGFVVDARLTYQPGSDIDVHAWSQQEEGVIGRLLEAPGSIAFDLVAEGFETRLLGGEIRAGEILDFGDIVLTRNGGLLPAPARWIGASPRLVPGETRDIAISGRGFLPDDVLSVTGPPWITINSFEVASWSRIDANITVDTMAPDPYTGTLRIEGPRGGANGIYTIATQPEPTVLTGVDELRVSKTDRTLQLSWIPVTEDVGGEPASADYEVFSGTIGGQFDDELVRVSVGGPEVDLPTDDVAGSEFFFVRAVSCNHLPGLLRD